MYVLSYKRFCSVFIDRSNFTYNYNFYIRSLSSTTINGSLYI